VRKDKQVPNTDTVDSFEEKFWMRESIALKRTEALVGYLDNPVKPTRKYSKRKSDKHDLASDDVMETPRKLGGRPGGESEGEDTDEILEDSKKIKKVKRAPSSMVHPHQLPPVQLYRDDDQMIAEELQQLKRNYHYEHPNRGYEEETSGQSYDYHYYDHHRPYEQYTLPPIQGLHQPHHSSVPPIQSPPLPDYGHSSHRYHGMDHGSHLSSPHHSGSGHHTPTHGAYQPLPPIIPYPPQHQRYSDNQNSVPMKRPMYEEEASVKKAKQEEYSHEQYYQ
jgi:hypothetical protein